jgi:hypothetical protein
MDGRTSHIPTGANAPHGLAIHGRQASHTLNTKTRQYTDRYIHTHSLPRCKQTLAAHSDQPSHLQHMCHSWPHAHLLGTINNHGSSGNLGTLDNGTAGGLCCMITAAGDGCHQGKWQEGHTRASVCVKEVDGTRGTMDCGLLLPLCFSPTPCMLHRLWAPACLPACLPASLLFRATLSVIANTYACAHRCTSPPCACCTPRLAATPAGRLRTLHQPAENTPPQHQSACVQVPKQTPTHVGRQLSCKRHSPKT